MKHFFSTLCLAAMLLLGSCGGGSDKLTGEDYEDMVDYMYEAMCEINEINQTTDPSDVEYAASAGQEVAREYPDVPEYFEIVMTAVRDKDPEIENSNVDTTKLARVIDCMGRGWGVFWEK